MNAYKIIGYPLFLISALEAVFAFVVLKKNPRNSNINKAVSVIGFSSSLYCLFAAIVYTRASMGLNYDVFYRACHIGWLGLPAFYQTAYYINDEKSRQALIYSLILYPFWSAVVILNLTTNWIEQGVYSLIPYVDRYGPLERPVRFLGGALLVWIIIKLFYLRKESIGIKKAQFNYFILGCIFYASGGALGAGFLQMFGGWGIDPALVCYFSLPWLALTVYAITRYRLFDIQVFFSRLLSAIALIALFAVIQTALFKIVNIAVDSTLAVLISLSATAVIFYSTPLMKKTQKAVNNLILKDKYYYQDLLKESVKAIVTILDSNELLNYLVETIKNNLKIEKVCLFLKDEGNTYYISRAWGIDKDMAQSFRVENKLTEWLKENRQVFIKEEQERLLSQVRFETLYNNMESLQAELTIPLFFKDGLIGLLTLGTKGNKEPFIQSDIEILETLANQTAIAIENARLYGEAVTDSLTGLYHQKYFRLRFAEEVARFKRYKHDLSLLMIDIDYFKKINDSRGHLTGDNILRRLASLLKENTRTAADIVCRYGGEEFAILLPNSNKEGALILAQRIRERVEAEIFEDTIKITVSIGISCCCEAESGLTDTQLIEQADQALYRAKENGRNKVEVSG